MAAQLKVVGLDGDSVNTDRQKALEAALAQIDRGDDDHRLSLTTAAKFSSSRIPAFWLFSG